MAENKWRMTEDEVGGFNRGNPTPSFCEIFSIFPALIRISR